MRVKGQRKNKKTNNFFFNKTAFSYLYFHLLYSLRKVLLALPVLLQVLVVLCHSVQCHSLDNNQPVRAQGVKNLHESRDSFTAINSIYSTLFYFYALPLNHLILTQFESYGDKKKQDLFTEYFFKMVSGLLTKLRSFVPRVM